MIVNLILERIRRTRLPVFVWLALLLSALAAEPFWAAAAPDSSVLRHDPTVMAVQKVIPSVVNIATKNYVHVQDPFQNWFNQYWDPYYRRRQPDSPYSLGSGVVIDAAGYLLTNNHVIKRANKIAVRFADQTNTYAARVVATDPKSDVALLKIEAPPGTKFHAIKFAREDDLMLGETVLSLGNPFGLGCSVTRGILSSKSRRAPKEGQPLDYQNWLQTDASINPGNSGGPLINLEGELIGINVAVLNEVAGQPAQGIGFAIPIKLVMRSLSDIFDTEYVKSYWFGARVKVGTSPLRVTSVQPQSPAGRAGLRAGDAIRSVDGKTPGSFIDLANLLAADAQSDVTLAVQRGGARKDFTIELVPVASVFNAKMIRDTLGLSLHRTSDGFVITGVQPSSPADSAGLQRGMLVREVDGDSPPQNVTELAKLIYAKKPGEPVRFKIAMVERIGNFNVLRQGDVQLVPRQTEN